MHWREIERFISPDTAGPDRSYTKLGRQAAHVFVDVLQTTDMEGQRAASDVQKYMEQFMLMAREMSPALRATHVVAGWMAAVVGLGMTSGHAFWAAFGAKELRSGLAQAALLCVAADVLFALALIRKGKGASRVVCGFFAMAGVAVTVAALGRIQGMWISGLG